MRIIAGTAKSLPLTAPIGTKTRPTTDRIKETLFNMIQQKLPGAHFLDLFAGSGGIGLEAISRGAAHAIFIEQDRQAAACIRKNISFTGFEKESTLLCMDVRAGLLHLEGNESFDLVFLDPPYEQGLEVEVLEILKNSSMIHSDTIIIIETSTYTDPSLVEAYGFQLTKIKKYKTNAHLFIKRCEMPAKAGGWEQV